MDQNLNALMQPSSWMTIQWVCQSFHICSKQCRSICDFLSWCVSILKPYVERQANFFHRLLSCVKQIRFVHSQHTQGARIWNSLLQSKGVNLGDHGMIRSRRYWLSNFQTTWWPVTKSGGAFHSRAKLFPLHRYKGGLGSLGGRNNHISHTLNLTVFKMDKKRLVAQAIR